MNAILWSVVTAVVVAVLAYAWQQRGRAALAKELDNAQRSQSVAVSRLADLTTQHARLEMERHSERESRRAVDKEREHLSGQLQVAAAQRTAAAKALADTDSQRLDLDAECHALQVRVTKTSSDCAALEAIVRTLREQLARQKQAFEEQTTQLKGAVATDIARVMEERVRDLAKEVDAAVAPFKVRLEELRKRVDEIHRLEVSARTRLDERIVSLTESLGNPGGRADQTARG